MAETIAEALRELEGAKARALRDATLAADTMKKSLVEQLLPVLDNLDRTIAHADPTLVEGVAMVRAQLEGVLRGYGVERIDAKSAPFDPALHDAITTAPVATRAEDNLVVDQLAAGYRYGDALLRPAKVVVGKFVQPAPAPVPIPVPETSRIAPPPPRIAAPAPPRIAAAPLRNITPLPIAAAPTRGITPLPIRPRRPEVDPYDFDTRPIRRAIPPQYVRDPWGRLIRRY